MTGLVGPGSVGMPTYTGMEAEPVPDPSPGSFSVLYDGTWGPTPPEDERREHWGLPPLPVAQQAATPAARRGTPTPAAPRAAPAPTPPAPRRP